MDYGLFGYSMQYKLGIGSVLARERWVGSHAGSMNSTKVQNPRRYGDAHSA